MSANAIEMTKWLHHVKTATSHSVLQLNYMIYSITLLFTGLSEHAKYPE